MSKQVPIYCWWCWSPCCLNAYQSTTLMYFLIDAWLWEANEDTASIVGRQPWTSIFQFRRTKSRIQFDNIFWFISLLSTTKKKFPKINLHDSELMTYVHVHGRQLPKLLLHIQYYHWWLEIPMGIWIIAS